jgi:hypothetical protein
MTRQPFRTDYRLWILAAGCVFVALGFVDPVAGAAKGDNSWWAYVGFLLRGDYSCSTGEIIGAITFRGALQAVPSVLVGWVLQALVVVGWSSPRRRTSLDQATTGVVVAGRNRCR